MRYTSLKTKYIAGVCCLILSVVGLLLAYMYQEFDRRLENELHKRGTSIARNLAIQSLTPILTENNISLQLLLKETDRNEADIRYIYLLDRQGRVLAHTFEEVFPPDLLKTQVPGGDSEKPHITTIQTEESLVLDVSVPIHAGDFGRVHVGFSENFISQELHHILLKGLPFIVLILLVGIGAAWWLAAKITGPLAHLSENVRKVGAGEFNGEIEEISNDEVGELSHAYNTMIRQLRELTSEQMRTEHELRMQTGMLEEEIAERQEAQQQLAFKQQQLETLNRVLEERVSTAVNELRLKDKVMMLQGRQAAMGEMINNIAHQWRQPINNLGLIVQGMKLDYDEGALTAEQMDEDVDKIMKTIMFMSQTINDFNRFFSPDRNRTTFSIHKGLKKVVAMMEATLFAQSINLRIEQRDEVMVEGYFSEYNQVLLNLLNNAKDILIERAVAKPVIKVTILYENGTAVLKVQDNAGGIPEDIIGLIFAPYFTTKEEGKGSGIGLYMSKMIIDEHFGGSITVRNTEEGAEFTVRTPSATPVDECSDAVSLSVPG